MRLPLHISNPDSPRHSRYLRICDRVLVVTLLAIYVAMLLDFKPTLLFCHQSAAACLIFGLGGPFVVAFMAVVLVAFLYHTSKWFFDWIRGY